MNKILYAVLAAAFMLTSCGTHQPQTLTVMTHDSFSISAEVIAGFEEAHNAKVEFVKSGDAGEVVNRAILTKNAPVADLLYGVDNTFLSRALAEGVFDPYPSPRLANIADAFQFDPSNSVTPIDFGDVCINYDIAYFNENNLPVPQSLDDLIKPEYRNLLVVENPRTSSPGLAFLIATVVKYGGGFTSYWETLRGNGVVVADSWETAYYTYFSGSSGRGPQPMVVSYATSPAAEVVFADPPIDTAPTGSITSAGSCFRQIEFAGILKGSPHRDLAQKFIDFMLSPTFQNDLPLQMFVYPVVDDAVIPDVFQTFAPQVESPASLSPDQIAQNREQWIRLWEDIMLR